jgi:hypothetical protein
VIQPSTVAAGEGHYFLREGALPFLLSFFAKLKTTTTAPTVYTGYKLRRDTSSTPGLKLSY